jgi:hypothetical protein
VPGLIDTGHIVALHDSQKWEVFSTTPQIASAALFFCFAQIAADRKKSNTSAAASLCGGMRQILCPGHNPIVLLGHRHEQAL